MNGCLYEAIGFKINFTISATTTRTKLNVHKRRMVAHATYWIHPERRFWASPLIRPSPLILTGHRRSEAPEPFSMWPLWPGSARAALNPGHSTTTKWGSFRPDLCTPQLSRGLSLHNQRPCLTLSHKTTGTLVFPLTSSAGAGLDQILSSSSQVCSNTFTAHRSQMTRMQTRGVMFPPPSIVALGPVKGVIGGALLEPGARLRRTQLRVSRRR